MKIDYLFFRYYVTFMSFVIKAKKYENIKFKDFVKQSKFFTIFSNNRKKLILQVRFYGFGKLCHMSYLAYFRLDYVK